MHKPSTHWKINPGLCNSSECYSMGGTCTDSKLILTDTKRWSVSSLKYSRISHWHLWQMVPQFHLMYVSRWSYETALFWVGLLSHLAHFCLFLLAPCGFLRSQTKMFPRELSTEVVSHWTWYLLEKNMFYPKWLLLSVISQIKIARLCGHLEGFYRSVDTASSCNKSPATS